MVVGLLRQVPVDVHRTVLSIGLDIWCHLLWVEESHRGQLTCGTHEGFLGEEVSRLGAKLTAHHILVEAVVTIDAHMAQMGLRTFQHTHLQVDGVADNILLSRVDGREDITVVVVEVGHGIVVFSESLVEQLLIVDITLSHSQQIGKVS